MKAIIYDTETSGLPKNYKASYKDTENWPRLVMLNWDVWEFSFEEERIVNSDSIPVSKCNVLQEPKLVTRSVNIIKPEGFTIPEQASKIHGITQERALAEGRPLVDVLKEFKTAAAECEYEVGHNVKSYDRNVVAAEFERLRLDYDKAINFGIYPDRWKDYGELLLISSKERTLIDTMLSSTDFCALPGPYGNKWPKLSELYRKLFNKDFECAHTEGDVPATAECFFELLRLGVIKL